MRRYRSVQELLGIIRHNIDCTLYLHSFTGDCCKFNGIYCYGGKVNYVLLIGWGAGPKTVGLSGTFPPEISQLADVISM